MRVCLPAWHGEKTDRKFKLHGLGPVSESSPSPMWSRHQKRKSTNQPTNRISQNGTDTEERPSARSTLLWKLSCRISSSSRGSRESSWLTGHGGSATNGRGGI